MSTSWQDLNLVYPSEISTNEKPLLSAMFLIKFDVNSGYNIEWSQTASPEISLNGIEFKCLPSGLHSVEKDLIYFIQPTEINLQKNHDEDPFEKIMYGISIFKQNLNQVKHDRNDVKMYSLGFLVDPTKNLNLSNTFPKNFVSKYLPIWKPINYTSGWEYINEVKSLLDEFMDEADYDDFTSFTKFFDKNKLDIKNQAQGPKQVENSNHMLLNFPTLIEMVGPLIFPIWKNGLLRKKIMIFDTPSIETGCSFSYIISVISTLPQEILPLLVQSGVKDINQYIQPLYSIGVNDIDWLTKISESKSRSAKNGFIACTTDEILLYKTNLYDVGIRFPSSSNSIKLPKLVKADSMQVGKVEQSIKGTFKDLNDLKMIDSEYGLIELFQSLHYDSQLHNIRDKDEYEYKWWSEVSDKKSILKYTIDGFFWWASSGTNFEGDDERNKEFLNKKLNFNKIPKKLNTILNLVGFFQKKTIRIFKTLSEIISNESSGEIPNNEGEEEEENDDNDERNIIYLTSNDIEDMGLDSYSSNDCEFVIELAKLYWNKKVRISNKVGLFC